MPTTLPATEVLNRYFLDTRARILDIAAALDRLDRTSDMQTARNDPRVGKLHDALCILTDGKPDRAERVQMLLSQAYDPHWRQA